jgi:hypothetical protein
MIGWRIDLDLVFPNGASPGEGKDATTVTIARDGQNRAVLRGTSLAGRLRSSLALSPNEMESYFGQACGAGLPDGGGLGSRLVFEDSVIGQDGSSIERTFHARDRHTGAVLNKSLFSVEATQPGVSARSTIWLLPSAESNEKDDRSVLEAIVRAFQVGLTLGGRSNRGFGLAILGKAGATIRRYGIRDSLGDHAAWLDDRRALRLGHEPSKGDLVVISPDSVKDVLKIRVPVRVPRGQDLLIGDGRGEERSTEPQVVTASDGKRYWRLPGSSFRGAFRAWCHRLAIREFGEVRVADTRARRRRFLTATGTAPTGREVGWCYAAPAMNPDDGPGAECVVASLFGSLHARGRIHVSDVHVPAARLEPQDRQHVAVDGISGGCIEGLLFDSRCLTDPKAGKAAIGEIEIVIQRPAEHEVQWIALCLSALDMGLIRLGSSKSAGRLEIGGKIEAIGDGAVALLQRLETLCGKGGA